MVRFLTILLALAGVGAGNVPIAVSLQTAQATTITVSTILMPSGMCRVIVKGQTVGHSAARKFEADVMTTCPVTVVYDGALKINSEECWMFNGQRLCWHNPKP